MNTDGAMDNTFGGTDGLAETSFAGGSVALSVVIDGSSKIYASVAGNSNFATAWFTSTGGVDTSWGVTGSNNGDFAVARYMTAGALDTTFDSDGKKTIDVGNSTTDAARSVAIDANGKILIGGDSGGNFVLVRLNADGTFDSSFNYSGTSGISVAADFGSTDAVKDIALQGDGRIVAVGLAAAGLSDAVEVLASVGTAKTERHFVPPSVTQAEFSGRLVELYFVGRIVGHVAGLAATPRRVQQLHPAGVCGVSRRERVTRAFQFSAYGW